MMQIIIYDSILIFIYFEEKKNQIILNYIFFQNLKNI